MMLLKMSFLFRGMIFRFHVKLWEGKQPEVLEIQGLAFSSKLNSRVG